jgi:epoxyqueuosine reductase
MLNMENSGDASTLTDEIKRRALAYGADLVGITSTETIDAIPKHWVGWDYQEYTRKSTDYMDDSRSVIILGFQAWDDIHEIQIKRRGKWEYPAYQRMRLYTRRLLRNIQSMGLKGIVYPELMSQKRMAQLAGLGNFGKNSLILNPRYGPWIRLQSILTDAELVPDKPFENDLCGDCEACIKACPVKAITPYTVDADRCSEHMNNMPPFTKNSTLMCTECQRVCPLGREERGMPTLNLPKNTSL